MFPDYNAYNQYYGFNNNDNFGGNILSNGFDFRNMNNSMMNMNNNDEIISLNQAVQMIRKTISESRKDDMFLEKLIKLAPTEKDKDILKQIHNDKRNHDRILRDVYYNLTGQMAGNEYPINHSPDNNQEEHDEDKKYNEMLEELLFDKFDCIVKFRRILGTMPSGENYILIMSILTDDIKDSGKINFLIHRAS